MVRLRTWLLCFAIAIAFYSRPSHAWHDVNAKHFSNALAEWLSNFIPRLDLFGKHLPGAFAPSKSYFESLIVIGIPFASIGIFGLLLVCTITTWKLVRMDKTFQGEYQIEISRQAGIVFLGISAILIGACVGLLGANTVFHGAMQNLEHVMVGSADELMHRGTSTMGLIESTNLTMITSTTNIMSIYNITKSALEELLGKQQLFNDVEELRYACIASACAILIVGGMSLIHILTAGRSMRTENLSWSAPLDKLSVGAVIGFGVLQCLMWGGSGLHATVSVLSADLCNAGDDLQASLVQPLSVALSADPTILAEYVDYFAYCNTSSPFSGAFEAADNLVISLRRNINISIQNHADPNIIAILQNNTNQLETVLGSLNQLFALLDYQRYYSTRELICVNTLNSGFVAATILGTIGLVLLGQALFITRCVYTSKRQPQYTLVLDSDT